MTNPSQHPQHSGPFYLTFDAAIQAPQGQPVDAQTNARKRFRGVAYSGGVVPQHWDGDTIIDLSTMQIPPVLFALVNHDPRERAGRATPRLEGGQLVVEGEFSAVTPSGQQISAEFEEGAPWQMSVGINGDADYSDRKRNMEVNGQTVSVNTIIRSARLLEVSFVPAGADPNTSATLFSCALQEGIMPDPNLTSSIEEATRLRAELAAVVVDRDQQKARAETAETSLSALRDTTRKATLTPLFAATDQTLDDATFAPYRDMTDTQFCAVVSVLTAMQPKPGAGAPAHLFQMQSAKGDAGGGGNIVAFDSKKAYETFEANTKRVNA